MGCLGGCPSMARLHQNVTVSFPLAMLPFLASFKKGQMSPFLVALVEGCPEYKAFVKKGQ
jgi:hypothetical protein